MIIFRDLYWDALSESLNHEGVFLRIVRYNGVPVYKATYDLLLAIFRFTKDFGKEYKYTVGESLKKETEKTNETLTACKRNPLGMRLHVKRYMQLHTAFF